MFGQDLLLFLLVCDCWEKRKKLLELGTGRVFFDDFVPMDQ